MKYFYERKITKSALLILTLVLALPIKSMASEVKDTKSTNITEITDRINENDEAFDNLVNMDINQSLSDDNKKINYELIITKNNADADDLKAIFNIPNSSNISNLNLLSISSERKVEKEDITINSNEDFEELSLNLKELQVIKLSLSVDIKENTDDNLDLGLSLLSNKLNYKSTYRFDSYIKDKKLLLNKNQSLSSSINGKIDQDKISWTDYLLNTTGEDIDVNYPITLSHNQNIDDSKLTLEVFDLDDTGYRSVEKGEFELGDISGLILNPNSIVKISFDTKLLDDSEEFSFNNKTIVKKVNKEIESVNTKDKKQSENSVLNLIDEMEKDTQNINKTISDNDKKTDQKESIQSSDKKIETKPIDKENSMENPDYVISLTDEIKNSNEEIINLIKDKDIEYSNLISNQNTKEVPTLSTKDGNRDVDVLIEDIKKANKEIQDLIRDEKTNMINTPVVKEDTNIKSSEVINLTNDITKTNDKITEILRQVELSIESEKVMDNPKDLKEISLLLDEIKRNQDNTKYLLESSNIKEDEDIKNGFRIVVPGYSQKRYEELEKLVNLIQKPDKLTNDISKEEVTKKYTSISYYLSNLEIRTKLLNNK